MQTFAINYLALIAAALVRVVLGMVLYSPPVFGKRWAEFTGCGPDEMKARLPKLVLADVVASLFMAYGMIEAIHYTATTAIGQGAALGFFSWLAFVATVTLGISLWENRPLALWLMSNTYNLLALVLMGVVLTAWP